MNGINTSPYYHGQEVVCLVQCPEHGQIKDKTYVVTDVKTCCGKTIISYGVAASGEVNCTACSSLIIEDGCELYAPASEFAPARKMKMPLLKLSRVIEEEHELVSAN